VIEVADATAPILRLAGSKRQPLRQRLAVRARCPLEPCTVQAHGVLVTSFERDGETHHRTHRLAAAGAPQFSRSWRTLRLRVSAGARRGAEEALLDGGEAKAKIAVVARDQDGELRLRQRKVELGLR
jgi:hypothetical protein